MEKTANMPTADRNWHIQQAIGWADQTPVIAIKAVDEQDISTFEEMVDRCEDKAYSLAMQLVRSEPAAQEILQQTFLLAWQNRQRFAGRTQFGNWVYRAVGKAAIERLHAAPKSQREASAGGPVRSFQNSPKFGTRARADKESDWSARPSHQLLSEELCRHIRKTVDSLSTELRTMFILCDSEAMSLEDGAAILNLPVADAKVDLQAARLAVRAAISDYFCGDGNDGVSASGRDGVDPRLLSEGSLTDP